jgi:ribonucleoside-triphosphate reductase
MNEGDGASKPLLTPALFMKIRKRVYTSNPATECLMKGYKLAERWGNVFFVNQSLPWQTENVSYNSNLSRTDSSWKDWESGTIRVGSLDNITINLPRIAYESRGDDDKFYEKMKEMLELAKEALLIKRQVLNDRIQSDSLLPLFKTEIDGACYFRLNDSPGIISYIGLPEAVKYHTGLEISDNEDAMRFATKVVGQMDEFSSHSQSTIRLLSSSITFEPAAQRLTNLDVVAGHLKPKAADCYTEHSNLPLTTAIPLKSRLKIEEIFQHTTRGGHLFDIHLSEPFPTHNLLANYTKRIFETTGIGLLTFTRDYTYCFHCKTVTYGFHAKCPKCAYDGNRLVFYTKTYGRYKSSKAWNSSERDYAFNNKRFTL